jgi:small nuclear ribonucleoprotein (snRNP)-like protein
MFDNSQKEKITELKKFISQYNISDEDLIIMSENVNKMDEAGFFGKEKFKKTLRDCKNKYSIAFLDWGGFIICFRNISQITNENLDSFHSFMSESQKEDVANKAKFEEENDKIIFEKLNILKGQIRDLSKIEIPEVKKYKSLIEDNEDEIINLGKDEKLFEFLKIDTFLNDFKNNIESNISGLQDFSFYDVENAIRANDRKKRNGKVESMQEILNKMDEMIAGNYESFEDKLDKLYSMGNNFNESIESAVLTFKLYESYAISCLVFYLTKKKINYFEIHSAFEKLGVFDSSWQKSVKGTLKSIDDRLNLIDNNLTKLNGQFNNLIESNERNSELISEGLTQIKTSIDANTVVSVFTAYQAWKTNKNTKGLIN